MILFSSSISGYSFISGGIIFCGYILKSLSIQYIFYYNSDGKFLIDNPSSSYLSSSSNAFRHNQLWGWPLLSFKPFRGPFHGLITAWNLIMASVFAIFVTECYCRSLTCMHFDPLNKYGLHRVLMDFLLAVVHQSILEYYWHRLMHYKFFYSVFHKIHHYYKSPEPWEDMYIHPLEAFGYYCILYSPPFIYHVHSYSFVAYMIVMGICGVLDHSGVRISLFGIYSTVDHSYHHEKFNVNYSFPFPYMDMLHGTYFRQPNAFASKH